MALINFDNDLDPWILEHDTCERLQRDIMEQLNSRSKERRTSDQFARLSASVRLGLKQYSGQIEQLKQKNDKASMYRTITSEEYERRTRQIELLQSKFVYMNSLFNEQHKDQSKLSEERSNLFGDTTASKNVRDLGTVDWGTGEEDTSIATASNAQIYSVADIKRTQQQLLEEQNKGLDHLSEIISRQKNIAETIHTEVGLQNEIIDDLADNMDRTHNRIRTETQNIRIIDRKDSTWGYWLIIISLFFCIVIVEIIL
ncbi:syntaxin-8 [Chrysoperla carnea]|uniref:syntaxin-8 n=1 Tax=Chrysoperla carnea TaxID=189513 RepID=UPI001D06B4EC|nr:syntaxin-8 [Chrysoperla carnea]